MSIRINGDKEALRRTTSLPTSHAAFTICACFKLEAGSGTREAHLMYTQNTGAAHAESLFLTGSGGTTLRGADSYGTTSTADVANVPSGGADGTNWFFAALVGVGSGANGLRAYHKPIGSGSLTFQSVTNSPGTSGFEVIQFGDLPFGTTYWFDGYIAHLKVYNRALSDAELAAEAASAAPVTTADLLSYHSFSSGTLATALAPDQGSGTFTTFTSDPTTDADMPVFTVTPTLSLMDTLPASAGLVRPGAPTILTATALSARTAQATWSAASGTVDGYRVYAQRVGGQPFVIATTTSALIATGIGMDPAVGYTITVRAFNGAGESDPSGGLPITTRRILVRMTKVESSIFGETGVRMLVWQNGTAPNLVGGFVCEAPSVVISPPVFDPVEAEDVCVVTADISGLTNLPLTDGGTVRALLGKSANARFTGIEPATIVEAA